MDKFCQPKIYGIVGYPVKHSLSPLMQAAAFRALNIKAEYRLFEKPPEQLDGFLLKEIFEQNVSGLNITIPHKVKALQILESNPQILNQDFPYVERDNLINTEVLYAKMAGAVNTIQVFSNGKIAYLNTDLLGFQRSLEKDLRFTSSGKNALVLGCGGAGRAVIVGLFLDGIETIYITDVNNDVLSNAKDHFLKFPDLNKKLVFISNEKIPEIIGGCHLLVNASPIGMREETGCLIDSKLLRKDLFVYDVVYNRQTKLVSDALKNGCNAVGGLGMLLYQGVLSLEYWLDQKLRPEVVEIMRSVLSEGIKKS